MTEWLNRTELSTAYKDIIKIRSYLCASILRTHKNAQPIDMHHMPQAKEEINSDLVMILILAY